MTERILHYPAAPTCGFFFLSHFGGVVVFPVWCYCYRAGLCLSP